MAMSKLLTDIALTLLLLATAADAVTVFPFIPNETPLLFENTIVPLLAEAPPALMAAGPVWLALAVTVEPDIPNETLFELLKTTVPAPTDDPAALIAAGPVD
jgi:hypothetical protein